MRVELAPALILHRRAWRDTSVMLEAYTRCHGRVGLIARGARRSKARWRGLLEPLADVRLSWSGRGELYTLSDVELERRFMLDGNRLWSGFYASELVLRLSAREDPQAAIYDSLLALLQALHAGAPGVVALRFFERDLLDALGYGLSLTQEVETGHPVQAQAMYAWQPERGLYAGTPGEGGTTIAGSALLGLARGRFDTRADIHAARRLLGAVIATHLDGRPLQTLQTMRAMRQFDVASSETREHHA